MIWPFNKPSAQWPRFDALAPDGLCDLHSHVLYGVDDGARDIEESRAMLRGFADLGYREVVTTPHFDIAAGVPDLQTRERLCAEIGGGLPAGSHVLRAAGEIMFDESFFAAEERLPRLGPGRIYLVEFGHVPGCVPLGLEDLAFGFKVKGGTLVLAHPERYADFQRDPARLERVARGGALLQLDLLALVGAYGQRADRFARGLIERGQYALASSDLHSPTDLPRLCEALVELARIDESAFRALCSENPMAVADGRADELEVYA